MMEARYVGVIDDDVGIRHVLRDILEREGAQVSLSADADEGLEMIRTKPIDALFVDLRLGRQDGIAVLTEARRIRPHLPIVVVTGYGSLETSIAALRLGTVDYLTKPFTAGQISAALARCCRARFLAKSVDSKRPPSAVTEMPSEELIAVSQNMRVIATAALQAARSELPLVLYGETGTGKELLARVMHHRGGQGNFVRVHCASLQEHQLDTLLFGRSRNRVTEVPPGGLVDDAAGGTVYLHDICELPFNIQARLAEFVHKRSIDSEAKPAAAGSSVRIIAGTSYPRSVACERALLNKELVHVMGHLSIEIPPLRERPEDILALGNYFIESYTKSTGNPEAKNISFPPDLWELVLEYRWPGNVRELLNFIKRSIILGDGKPDRVALAASQELASLMERKGGNEDLPSVPIHGTLKDIEVQIIKETINKFNGNKAAAARSLGLHRKTLYRLLRE